MSDFHEASTKFIFQRTIHHSPLIASRHVSYTDLSTTLYPMFDDIKHQLPEEYIEFLYEFESNINHLQSLSEAFMYEQGLKDGLVLSKILFE